MCLVFLDSWIQYWFVVNEHPTACGSKSCAPFLSNFPLHLWIDLAYLAFYQIAVTLKQQIKKKFRRSVTEQQIWRQKSKGSLACWTPKSAPIKSLKLLAAFVASLGRLGASRRTTKAFPGSLAMVAGHNKVMDNNFLTGVMAEIEANPETVKREMAKFIRVDEKTIRTTIKELGAYSYKKRQRPILVGATMERMLNEGKLLLNQLKKQKTTIRIFSDKKLWTVEQAHNTQKKQIPRLFHQRCPPSACQQAPSISHDAWCYC